MTRLGSRFGLVASLAVAVLTTALPTASADTFASPSTGSHSVGGAILGDYRAVGGPNGVLGYPTTEELPTRNGIGRFNAFQHGSIYWMPSLGAHSVRGAIRGEWAATGWENGPLGFPTTDQLPTRQVGGAHSTFQFGSIYFSPATGAHAVGGAILGEWGRTGWENGRLGFPTTGELPTRDGAGSFNHFQGGSIYWSASTNAHEVRGAIRSAWAAMGWEDSALGYPTSDEYAAVGGTRQNFQNGSLTWTAARGVVPDITFRGSGTTVVPIQKGAAPMIAALTYSGPNSNFIVQSLGANNQSLDLLANEITPNYAAVVPLDFAKWGAQQTRAFQVESSGSWTIHIMPLSAVWNFGRGQTINAGGSTVYRYTGPAGIAHITGQASGNFAVTTYNSSTGYDNLLVNEIGAWTGDVPINGNVYVQIESNGPWNMTVH